MQGCQLSWIIRETPDFGPHQIRVWNLPNNRRILSLFVTSVLLSYFSARDQMWTVYMVHIHRRHASSPGYRTNLPLSRTGNQISRIKWIWGYGGRFDGEDGSSLFPCGGGVWWFDSLLTSLKNNPFSFTTFSFAKRGSKVSISIPSKQG